MKRVLAVVMCTVIATTLHAQIRFDSLPHYAIEKRLAQYGGNDTRREVTLKALFEEAGCKGSNLSEQEVPNRKQPNVLCILPGATDEVVIVGAHFDHADAGSGIVDNWSGASLLPSLYQSLAGIPRQRTYWFVGFTGEEKGLLGSDYFAKRLSDARAKKIRVMVTIDTLGLGPTEVWSAQSDPDRLKLLAGVSQAMKLPITNFDVSSFGDSDEESFIDRHICTVMFHSLTPQTAHILHTPQDSPTAIHQDNYYDSYRLITAFLAALDVEQLPADHACTTKRVQFAPRTRSLSPSPFRR